MTLYIPSMRASQVAIDEVQDKMKLLESFASRHESQLAAALSQITAVKLEEVSKPPELGIGPPPDIQKPNELPPFSFGGTEPPPNEVGGASKVTAPAPAPIEPINLTIPPPTFQTEVPQPKPVEFTGLSGTQVVPLPAQPTYVADELIIPPPPAPLDIDKILSDLNFQPIDLPDAPIEPVPNPLAAPTVSPIALPEKPPVDPHIELPEPPTITLPEMPPLVPMELPPFEYEPVEPFDSSAMPNVGEVEKYLSNIQADITKDTADYLKELNKGYADQYKEETKTTSLLMAQIDDWMTGSSTPWSGLPSAIEAALFNRAVDRESQVTNRAVDDAVNEWASRGFSMPQGMLQKQISSIRDQGALRASEASRETLIQSFPKQIEQLKWLIAQGMAVEQKLYERFKDQQALNLDVMKFQIESKWKIYDANVTLFNLQNEAYKLLFDVHKVAVEFAISKITAFKAQIDAQLALGQVNNQNIEIYKGQLSGIMTQVELYKTSTQAAQVRADSIKSQFDAFKSEVQVYAEQVNAEKIKVEAFEAEVKAETARLGVFESQSRNYATTLQGLSTQGDIQNKSNDAKLELAKVRLQEFSASIDEHKSNVADQLAMAQNNTSNFVRNVELFNSVVKHNIEMSNSETQYNDMLLRANIADADIQSKFSDSTARVAIANADLHSKNTDVITRVALAELDGRIKNAELATRTNLSNSEMAIRAEEANARINSANAEVSAKYADMRIRTNLAQVDAQSRYMDATSRTNIAMADIQARFAEMQTKTNIANADIQLKQYDSNTQKMIESAKISLEAAKSVGQLSAQLASGAMSAMHVSASISGSASESQSLSSNSSESTSHNYSY